MGDNMTTAIKTIAIVGLGVIGGSFAKAIKATFSKDYTVIGIDNDDATISQAIRDGVIDEGTSGHAGRLLQKADLVIICVYPSLVVDFVKMYQSDFKTGAIVTDVTGVKGVLLDALKQVVPEHVDFILGHPMAGSEKRGLAHAKDDMFTRANYIVTPVESNKSTNVEWLITFVKTLGFKRVTVTDPMHHDDMIAHTSQLSHIVSVALINANVNLEESIAFIGNSYRELTRISNINGPLWAELFIANQDSILDNIDRFQQELQQLKVAIAHKDKKTLMDILEKSSKRRQTLEQQDVQRYDNV